MRKFDNIIRVVFAIILLTVFSCSSSEDKAASHLERGVSYLNNGEYKAAIIEFRNVLQSEPKHAEARYNLGLAYLKTGDVRKAFPELKMAADLDPTNFDALLRTGELLYLGGKLKEGREFANTILKSEPNNIKALTLLANILIKGKEFDEAQETLNTALQEAPGSVPLHSLQAKLHIVTRQDELAEKELLKALELDPDFFQTYQLLVNFYLTVKDRAKARKYLQQMVKKFPDSLGPRIFESSFYLKGGDKVEAEKALKEGLTLFPGSQRLLTMLGKLYVRERNIEAAEHHLVNAIEKSENTNQARNELADFYYDMGRYDEAGELVAPTLKDDESNMGALLIQAKLLYQKKHYTDALVILEKLAVAKPRWADVYLQMGRIYLDKGQIELSHKNTMLAVQYNPNDSEARTLAAHHFLRKRQAEEARLESARALKLNSQNIAAAIIYGQSFLLENQPKEALKIFTQMNEKLPDNDEILYNMALAYKTDGNREMTKEMAESVVAVNPGHGRALLLLVHDDISQGKPEKAIAEILKLLDEKPGDEALLKILGDTYFGLAQYEMAKEVYTTLLSSRNNDPHLYMMLARIEKKTGDADMAITEYLALLENQPDNIQALMELGALYEQIGKTDEAKNRYSVILDINKKFAPAANNLAWVMMKEDEPDFDKALQLALVAKEALPDEGAISDTLGYIFLKRGSYDLAVHQFEHAASVSPDDPAIRYHLAMALKAKGELEPAKAELVKSLQSSIDFSERVDAENLLRQLQ